MRKRKKQEKIQEKETEKGGVYQPLDATLKCWLTSKGWSTPEAKCICSGMCTYLGLFLDSLERSKFSVCAALNV